MYENISNISQNYYKIYTNLEQNLPQQGIKKKLTFLSLGGLKDGA